MPKKDCSELALAIYQLSLNIAEDPDVKNIDEVVGEIQKSFPVMDANAIVDAIVDASTNEAKELDDLAQKLARIKREARSHSRLREKIEQVEQYLEEGKPPDAPEPREIGPESVEQLRKTSRKLRSWLNTADPKMRESLQGRLDALDAQIESGEIVMDRIQEAKLHDSLQGLQDQINIARKHIKDAKAVKRVMDEVNALQQHLEAGTLPAAKRKKAKGFGPVDALREIRDDLRRQVSQSDPARKQRLEKSIADLEARIKAGDFAPKAKKTPLPQSKALEKLIYQRNRLRRDVRVGMMELKPKTIWYHIAEPFNAIRALKTSFDLSAVFRQGGFIGLAHPVRAARALPDMMRALVSEEASSRINSEILNRPNAPLYARSKLYIAPIDGSERLVRMEEAYMSHLIERGARSNIPILSTVFKGVEASERAYLTFLNALRADSFDTMAATLTQNGEPTADEAMAIATFVNEATGRGSIGIEQAAVGLNTVFFAPKYTVSRFQLLLGHPLWAKTTQGGKRGGSNAVRKLVAQEYARYLIGVGAVLALGYAAGGEIEDDLRSADAGKVRFGNSRIDVFSGISQVTVLLARLITGETKSSTTGTVRPIRGEDVPYGGDTSAEVVARFLRGKLSPTFGIPMDVLSGQNVVGEPMTLGRAALEAPTPLAFDDIYEAMKDQGVPAGTALGLLSVFGMGLQTYEAKPKKRRAARRRGRRGASR